MGLNIEGKKAVVAEVSEQLANAQTIVIAEFRGITAASITKLRAQARESGVYLHVLKNTLVRRAAQGSRFEALAEHMVGPLIYSISADPIAAARVLHQFVKVDNKIVVKAGLYDGRLMDADQVVELAAIPSREELLARLMGVLQAPVARFVRLVVALAEKQSADAV